MGRIVSDPIKPDGEWRAMVRFLRSVAKGPESKPLACKWLEPDGVPESIFASVNYNILFCTTLVKARCGSGQLHQRHGSREPRKISRGYR